MTNYLSDKIKVVSFVLILLVLYIHSGFHANEIEGMYWNNFIQEFISGKLGRIAVPLFFILSGYLFFLKTKSSVLTLIPKLKSRLPSVVIPYIITCLFFFVVLTTIQLIPFLKPFINSDTSYLLNESIPDLIRIIFFKVNDGNTPFAFHLWFLRDLIIIFTFSPILYYFQKYLHWWGVLFLFCLTFMNITSLFSIITSFFWFSFGGVFSLNSKKIEGHAPKWTYSIFTFYIIISLLEQFIGNSHFIYFQNIFILIGIVGIWTFYDLIFGNFFSLKNNKWISLFCGFTFFIYLYHEPTINIIRKLFVLVIGKNSLGYLISYLLSPIIYVFLAVMLGSFLKRIIPKTYSVLVGGRI